jgi:hypothetical protein
MSSCSLATTVAMRRGRRETGRASRGGSEDWRPRCDGRGREEPLTTLLHKKLMSGSWFLSDDAVLILKPHVVQAVADGP